MDLTYELDDDLDATKFSTTIYYECTDNSGGICATVNTLGSDGTISFDETAISTDQVSNGTYKATRHRWWCRICGSYTIGILLTNDIEFYLIKDCLIHSDIVDLPQVHQTTLFQSITNS